MPGSVHAGLKLEGLLLSLELKVMPKVFSWVQVKHWYYFSALDFKSGGAEIMSMRIFLKHSMLD